MLPRPLPAVLGLLLFVAAGAPVGATASTASLLEGLRKAMLSRPIGSISAIRTSGKIEIFGLTGTVQEWDDVRNAHFRQSQVAGPLTGSSGWDGKTAWSQDYAGLTTIDGGESGRLQSADQAYLDSLQFLRPDAGGATIVYAGERTQNGKTYNVLAVTPRFGTEMDLWIDPQSHLIEEETASIGAISTTTVLSNYRRSDGILYPFSVSTQTSTGNNFAVKLSSLEVNPDLTGRMHVPPSTVRDSAVAGGSTTVPLQIANNHLYVGVMLNGRGPYTFVLDSGGDYIVTPEIAAALAAKSTGGMQLQGVGNASEGAAFTHIDSISIGGATVRNQYMLVLPIATGFGVAEGVRIDGMVGYQLLARFLTTIDYANSKITFVTPPAAPATVAGATPLAFAFDGTTPRIPINVDGVDTTGAVDTGSRAGLTLATPFLAANPQIAALAKTAPGVAGFGVGGPSYAKLGRVPRLQIGPFAIANSIANFGVQSKGAFADPYNPANVGGGIWRRFTVTLDYSHRQMLLAKNALFDTPYTYDRSGAFLINAGGTYKVLDVFPGSPAAAGGLAKGDVIVSVNGAPVANDSLAQLRTLLAGSVGTIVHLQVRGASGSERSITLTLADYV